MVRHILVMKLKKDFNAQQKSEHAKKLKEDLENMIHQIDTIKELKVYIDLLPTSSADIMMNSLFENEQTLAEYQVRPEHIKVSDYLFSVVEDIKCVDYIE